MSRHNVTYKPGGSIVKPLDIALKMQRVTPVAEVADIPACPACPETPPLVGAWVDSTGIPLIDETGAPVTNVDVAISRISVWMPGEAGGCCTTLDGFFLQSARFVNEDFVAVGIAAPLFIDESLCWWDVVWDGFGDQPLVSISGSSIAVAYNAQVGSGTLTITPYYNDVALPSITMTVTATIYNNCA